MSRAFAYAGRSVKPTYAPRGVRLRKLSEPTPRRPEAEKTTSLPSRSSSTAARTPARMIWPLKAPASPRSLVTSSSPTLPMSSRSCRIGTFGRFCAASAA